MALGRGMGLVLDKERLLFPLQLNPLGLLAEVSGDLSECISDLVNQGRIDTQKLLCHECHEALYLSLMSHAGL